MFNSPYKLQLILVGFAIVVSYSYIILMYNSLFLIIITLFSFFSSAIFTLCAAPATTRATSTRSFHLHFVFFFFLSFLLHNFKSFAQTLKKIIQLLGWSSIITLLLHYNFYLNCSYFHVIAGFSDLLSVRSDYFAMRCCWFVVLWVSSLSCSGGQWTVDFFLGAEHS